MRTPSTRLLLTLCSTPAPSFFIPPFAQSILKQKFDEVRQERIAKYQGMNLYVKNLADDTEDDQLRAEFAPYGTITSAKVRGRGGRRGGSAFMREAGRAGQGLTLRTTSYAPSLYPLEPSPHLLRVAAGGRQQEGSGASVCEAVVRDHVPCR